MTPLTVITLGEIMPGAPVVQVHRIQALPDEGPYDAAERLGLSRISHIFQGHPPYSDEPAVPLMIGASTVEQVLSELEAAHWLSGPPHERIRSLIGPK